jgi:hypothetical protein
MAQLVSQLLRRRRINLVRGEVPLDELAHGRDPVRGEEIPAANRENLFHSRLEPL